MKKLTFVTSVLLAVLASQSACDRVDFVNTGKSKQTSEHDSCAASEECAEPISCPPDYQNCDLDSAPSTDSTSTLNEFGRGEGALPAEDLNEEAFEIETLTEGGDEAYRICKSGARQTTQSLLDYPEGMGCPWGEHGNLVAKGSHVRARYEETQTIDLPKNAIICKIGLQSRSGHLHYDDFLFLNLENYLLAASNARLVEYLPKADGVSTWSFAAIRDKVMDEKPPVCLGSSSTCVLPPHDKNGPINLVIADRDIANLAAQLKGEAQLDFQLITTGDDNERDCFHTDLKLDVTIEYVLQ